MVFFDKFCPDLHGAPRNCNDDGDGDGDDRLAGTNPSACGGNADDKSAPSRAPVPPSTRMMMAAACRWCSKELGNAPVVVLSEGESDGRVGADGSCAGKEEGEVAGEGGGGALPRVLGLRQFLRDFVGGQAGEELARRGDLLRGVHLSHKVSAREATYCCVLFVSAGSDQRGSAPPSCWLRSVLSLPCSNGVHRPLCFVLPSFSSTASGLTGWLPAAGLISTPCLVFFVFALQTDRLNHKNTL